MGSHEALPSSKLWASASKEWVVQPKPKPGRKPKTEGSHTSDSANDNNERRIQNRAAQRAFRQRKQSHLAELQARIHMYEKGEIERNVALQNIAIRLKEENATLHQENQRLKQKIITLEQTTQSGRNERKRTKDDLLLESLKKSKHSFDPTNIQPHHWSTTRDACKMTTNKPLPSEAGVDDSHLVLIELSPAIVPSNINAAFHCGLCTESTACMCRKIATQPSQFEEFDVTAYGVSDTPTNMQPQPECSRTSILDHLPAYQPPVPLRRKEASSGDTMFTMIPAPQSNAPACTGDPSNCMACADDEFGKAFCTALNESVAKNATCLGSLSHREASGTILAGSDPSGRYESSSSSGALSVQTPPETIPTNDAWRQFKSHPNVAFVDLSLLADVVARRTSCSTPAINIAASGSSSAERPPIWPQSPPKLVPQDVLMKCAREKVREVETDAVRAALRLLDAKFV